METVTEHRDAVDQGVEPRERHTEGGNRVPDAEKVNAGPHRVVAGGEVGRLLPLLVPEAAPGAADQLRARPGQDAEAVDEVRVRLSSILKSL